MGYKWVFGYVPANKMKAVEDYCKKGRIKLIALHGMSQGRIVFVHHNDKVADAFQAWAESIGVKNVHWYRATSDSSVMRLNSPTNTKL